MIALPAGFTLRRFNNVLTVVVCLLATYMIVMPFIPRLSWWVSYSAPVISKKPTVSIPAANSPEVPAENKLFIPNLGMEEIIHEGSSARTLRQGVWHIPKTSSPDKGSNTVLAGHRYTFSGAGVFYNFDKVKLGDPISLYWDKKRYDYTVTKIIVVPPTAGEVQAPTKKSLLTIYTCTPFWSFTNRLVIQAEQGSES